MRLFLVLNFALFACAGTMPAQTASQPVRAEERQKQQQAVAKAQEKEAKHTNAVEFEGEKNFSDKELRAQLKEEIATIDEFGLTPARADDVAFFLELFYRKHGYLKAAVHYVIASSNRLLLR